MNIMKGMENVECTNGNDFFFLIKKEYWIIRMTWQRSHVSYET